MDLQLILTMIFHLVGGLGIFLLGMKYMQQGLQVVAGPRIRKMIHAVTANRFMAVGIGVFITSIIQSSSVTSVMVIGLVNSELMTFSGAIGVVMGANIGTTITGWILALKIGKYGLPILGVSAFGWLFLKKEKYRYLALTILGIGMIFFGLELMKNGFKPLRGMPEFESWFHAFEATDYIGVLKAVSVGCILTFIVQSSSATLGITIALATTGIIDFYTAAALVLGENIGTTITAFLASVGADDINAKRTAYFHMIFNVLGVAWITAIFHPVYMPIIKSFIDPSIQAADGTFPKMAAAIAAVHTGFNVTNTIIFLPLMTHLGKLIQKIGHDKKRPETGFLTHLDFQIGHSPVAAIEQSRHEIIRLDKRGKEMMDNLRAIISNDKNEKNQQNLSKEVFDREEIIDKVQIEITAFLTDLLSQSISHEIAEEARAQLRLADEYESVSDYITTVLKLYLRLQEANIRLSDIQQKELLDLHDTVAAYYDSVNKGLEKQGQIEYLSKNRKESLKITNKIRGLRDIHWHRLSEESFEPLISTSYMDIAAAYRRMKDHLLNIAEAFEGGKSIVI